MTFSPSTTRDSAIASTVKEYMNRRQKIGTKVHSLDITPEMKASVMQGQPLFQGNASGKPGDYASDLEGFQAFAKNKTGEDLHSAIRDYLIKRGDETGHEHIVIYDAKNGRVVEAGTTGQADKVKVPVSLMPLMEDPANNFTIHHNHTEHLAISYVDLKPLAWPGLRSVVAHTNENGLSAASLSKAAAENIYRDQSFVPIKNITEIEDKARASVIGTLNRAIKAKLLTQKIADTVQTDLVNMALDKAGIINYTTSHDLHEGEIKNAAKVVMGAINAAATVAKNHAMEVGVLPKENVNAGTQNDKGVGFGWPTRAIAVSAKDGMAEIYRRDAGAQSGAGAGRNMVSQRNDGNIQGAQNAGEGKGLKPFDLAQFDPEKNREFGKSISTAVAKVEGLIGKAIKGSPIERLAQGYQHLFQPELISEKATLADALVAQSKVKRQDAVNAIAKNIQRYINEWDKVPLDGQKAWMKDYESGKRNHPYDAVHKAMMDATHAAENQAMGRTPEEYYRDNYISHIFDDGDAVKRYFEQQVKKYGNDWFTKKRAFDLVEEAEKAGFKLKTYNPAELDQMRLMAGMDMIQHQQLLDRLAQSGLAAKVKDINKGDLETHISHEAALDLQANHFQVRAPDNKAWWIHSDLFPLWQNAMEQRGFQGAQNSIGDAYRYLQAARNIALPIELGFSLFHPMHVYSIHWATGLATAVEHAIKAPSFGEALHGFKEGFMMSSRAGIGPGGLNPIRMLKSGTAMERIASVEHPLLEAYKTPANKRTPWQKDVVDRYNDGGFTPLMSERDKIQFHAALTKAYNQKQFQKLIVPGALGALRAISSPFMEHWIPAMKADAYMTRTTLALRRDPTLATNDDKRAVVFRGIAKDLERTYGEMNYDTLFWNKKLKDVAKVAFISMGWKLAQLYYYMGKPAAEIPQLLYKWAKTGKVDRQAISYQSLMMPAYWIVGTMIGAMTCAALSGHSPHNYMDTQFPPTGEVTSDGTPVRIALPFFNKEAYSLKYHIDQNGPLKGISTFLGDMSPIPNMWSFANNEDHFGNPLISQWNWDQVSHMALYEMRPISKDLYDKAVRNNDKVAAKMAFVGAGVAPQYVGKTTFENKVAAQYYRERGAHGSVYQRDLENQYKQAVAENDQSKMAEARAALQKTGMTPLQVTGLTRAYKEPFINYMWRGTPGNGGGWHGLSAEAQIDLYSSATPAEKKTFYSMMKPDARRQVQPPQ